MKAISFIWILVAILLAANVKSGPVPSPALVRARSIVKSVDRNIGNLKTYSTTFATGTDRGGKIKVYRQNSAVVRIDLTIGLSNADRTDMFYYSKGTLIFVKSEKIGYAYSESKGFDFERPKTISRSAYYVMDRRLTLLSGSERLDSEGASSLIRDAEYLIRTVEHNQGIDGERLAR